MVKIAIAVDGEWEYPIYRDGNEYRIDLGGAFGLSDPLPFENDVKAITFLQKAVENDIWEV